MLKDRPDERQQNHTLHINTHMLLLFLLLLPLLLRVRFIATVTAALLY
jgi:hypothetical protein